MEWLNYHHLLYFWTVVREGSVSRAAARLRLAQPTISGQLRALENALGDKLFTRVGRKMVPTETGQIAYRYADEIFALGRELQDALKGRPVGQPVRFTVGIADVVPKLVAYRLLVPALHLAEPVRIVCREDSSDRLLADLALHTLDVVLSDAPARSGIKIRAFSHLLGECGVTFFGVSRLARKYRPGFPRSLDGAPILLPTDNTALRRSLDQWFDKLSIRPLVWSEFEDSALLKVFGQAGHGIFAGPSAIEADVRRQHRVEIIGRAEEVREQFFAISIERRLKHPAVIAMTETARAKVFASR